MTWRKHDTHAKETMAVKAALKAASITATVGHGKGTAWAWLHINLGPDPNPGHKLGFTIASEEWKQKSAQALKIAQDVTGRGGQYDGEINIFTQ